jgi:hypothetical protein
VSVRARKGDAIDPWLLSYINVLPCAAAYRRAQLLEAGGWVAKRDLGYEDWDLWMALAERRYRGIRTPDVVCRYRVHGTRRWRAVAKSQDAIFAELKRRHPLLFEKRSENKRVSAAPLRLKLGLPLVERLTFLPARSRVALSYLLINPLTVVHRSSSLRVYRARRALRGRLRKRAS